MLNTYTYKMNVSFKPVKARSILIIAIVAMFTISMIPAHSQTMFEDEKISSQGYILEEIGLLEDGEPGMARHMEMIPGTNTLAVADGENGVLLVDITNPDNMEVISQFIDFANEGEFAADVDIINSDRMIVYTELGNIYSVNISDIRNPVRETGYSWWGAARLGEVIKLQSPVDNAIFDLEPDYNYDGYYTFNSYNFTSSTYERTIYGEGGQFPVATGLIIDGNFAYISDTSSLYKYDISNGRLTLVSTLEGLQFPEFTSIYSPTLHLIETAETKFIVSTSGLVIDISGEKPVVTAEMRFEVSQIRDIIISSEGEMIVAGQDYIVSFDLNEFKETDRIRMDLTYYDVIFDEVNYFSTDDGVYAINFTQDDTAPSVSSPADVSEEFGNIVQGSVTWTVSDNYPSSYNIYKDGILVQQGAYTSTSEITFDYSNFAVGTYSLNIVVTDQAGNSASDLVMVTIYELNVPEISYQSSYEFNEGDTTNNFLKWTVNDESSTMYDLYINDTAVQSGNPVVDGLIGLNISHFTLGNYSIFLNVTDTFGNSATDSFIISVVELQGPSITYSGSTTFEIGSADYMSWGIYSEYAANYSILMEGETIVNNAPMTGPGVTFEISSLTVGTYNVTLVVTDENLISTSNSVTIDIFDDQIPIITYTGQYEYDINNVEKSATWEVSDSSQMYYSLEINSTTVVSNESVIDNSILYNIDYLDVGTYEFHLTIMDTSGNSASSSEIIGINDYSDEEPVSTTDETEPTTDQTESTTTTEDSDTSIPETTDSETTPQLELSFPALVAMLPFLITIMLRRRSS